VLGHVVQQRRHQRLAVEVPVGEDLGDGERVRDVRVAGLAGLPGVGGFRKAVRLGEARHVLRLQVAETALLKCGYCSGHGGRLTNLCLSPCKSTNFYLRVPYSVGRDAVGFFFSTSAPILPAAISRRAMT